MKSNFYKFAGGLAALLLVAILIAFAAFKARAQQYYTNSGGPAFGAYQYNQGYSTPLFPSRTLATQYAAGIITGYLPAGVTNVAAFGTNIYSTPPIINWAPTTNATVYLVSVTTTNFTLYVSPTNNANIYWEAVGH